MLPPNARIPAEFAAFPQLMTAIVEVEGVFDDPEITSIFTAGTTIVRAYRQHFSGSVLVAGTTFVTYELNGQKEVETTVIEGDTSVLKRIRVAPPYTLFADRLNECKRVAGAGGWLGTPPDEMNAADYAARDHYLAQIMRGHIAIGAS